MCANGLASVTFLVVLVAGRADLLNVHVVPHTHDDVGWLKTVDQYYYGANNSIQHAGVQYILDGVIQELADDPSRTFIYVEMAFFTRWWNEQTDVTKALVHKLVEDGQLEFINGGWCMNDEASTDYNAIIDQMSEGLRFISNTFGAKHRPRIAWHIDPFGHSAEQASLFAMMGFDGFFFGRIDYDDKNHRLNNSELEMIWRGSESLGQQTEIFTGVLYNGYGPPGGFCFDQRCADQPIMDDRDLFDYNVDERVTAFLKACVDQASHYRTDNIMLTMGSDFQYENANTWYKNLDKLIYHVKMTKSVNIFYSTPSRYLDAVHQANLTWNVKTDDFFPYADCPWCYWTGYFTSRPALKGYVRHLNGYLQTCRQLEAMHGLFADISPVKLGKAVGVAQHHDAVSGTEKQHVANDYATRLHIGQVECDELVGRAVGEMSVKESASTAPLKVATCEYLNISVCPATSDVDSFDIIVYNPVGRHDDSVVVRVPVNSEKVIVMDAMATDVACQILPVSPATLSVRGDRGDAQYDLVFIATVPPLGYNTYFIRRATSQQCTVSTVTQPTTDTIISNSHYKLTVDGRSGHIKEVANQMSGTVVTMDQQFLWYWSSEGHNKNSSQPSGAYIFRPNSSDTYPVNNVSNKASLTVAMGPIVQEVWQNFSSFAYQVVRLYANTNHVELEYTIGPIDVKDKKGKEIISRYTTNLATDKMWYTDANGREMKLRVRDTRATWKLNNTEPVAGNYYPVNSRISIQDVDSNVQLTVLTDRSQGGSSLYDGSVELMVHRRILKDDSRGVGEPLNEPGVTGDGLVVRGKHILLVDKIEESARGHRLLGEKLLLPATTLIHDAYQEAISVYASKHHTELGGLASDLPENVHLLTVQLLGKTNLLLRVEHMFAVKEDVTLSSSVTINIKEIFVKFKVNDCTEMTLGADQLLADVQRYNWNAAKGGHSQQQVDPSAITLVPMEIRTLLCDIVYN